MKNENSPGIRLIDANALLRQDDPTYDEEGFRVWYTTDITRAPTIDPFEKVGAICNENCGITRPHGNWADVGPFTFNGLTLLRFKCSICERHHFNKSNYCPTCGAQMSGGTL